MATMRCNMQTTHSLFDFETNTNYVFRQSQTGGGESIEPHKKHIEKPNVNSSHLNQVDQEITNFHLKFRSIQNREY